MRLLNFSKLFTASISLSLLIAVAAASKSPTVSSESGKFRGKTFVSRNGVEYEGYIGIRYGVVPERFEVSKFAPILEEVQDVVEFGSSCVHTHFGGTEIRVLGKEDCLFLNIYTPKADDKKRAVLVFIHGGGYTFGSADIYGANYLIDEDIVVVTLNYRLGIFGFLDTRDEMAKGNMGLKDQNLALKWVQKNINSFGGDKDRVTIMGESAGSASVLLQVISPLSKGLFQKAIALSGTPLNTWAFAETTLDKAVKVGAHLNCDVSSSQTLVTCLRSKPLDKILAAQSSLFTKWYIDPTFVFVPTMEKKNSKNPNPFLHQFPEDLMERGDFNRVPMLITLCKDEGLLIHSAVILRQEKLMNDLNREWGRVAPITFHYNQDPILKGHTKEVSIKLKQFYFNNEPVSQSTAENLTNIYTDVWFYRGIRETAIRMGMYTDIYLGVIARPHSDFSTLQLLGITEVLGVAHADDLSYLFSNGNLKDPLPLLARKQTSSDAEFSKGLVKQVANFIKTGDMKIQIGTGNSGTWNPVSKSELTSRKLNWLGIDNTPSVLINFAGSRAEFWDQIIKPDLSLKEEL